MISLSLSLYSYRYTRLARFPCVSVLICARAAAARHTTDVELDKTTQLQLLQRQIERLASQRMRQGQPNTRCAVRQYVWQGCDSKQVYFCSANGSGGAALISRAGVGASDRTLHVHFPLPTAHCPLPTAHYSAGKAPRPQETDPKPQQTEVRDDTQPGTAHGQLSTIAGSGSGSDDSVESSSDDGADNAPSSANVATQPNSVTATAKSSDQAAARVPKSNGVLLQFVGTW